MHHLTAEKHVSGVVVKHLIAIDRIPKNVSKGLESDPDTILYIPPLYYGLLFFSFFATKARQYCQTRMYKSFSCPR